MKTYIITVNGKQYEVTVEEKGSGITASNPAPAAAPPPAAAIVPPAPAPTPAAAPAPAPAAPRGAAAPGTITAPMPGKVVAIKVKAGTTVKEGQVLLILEAMKMENEIVATNAGTVKEVHVSEGASVNVGDPLVTVS